MRTNMKIFILNLLLVAADGASTTATSAAAEICCAAVDVNDPTIHENLHGVFKSVSLTPTCIALLGLCQIDEVKSKCSTECAVFDSANNPCTSVTKETAKTKFCTVFDPADSNLAMGLQMAAPKTCLATKQCKLAVATGDLCLTECGAFEKKCEDVVFSRECDGTATTTKTTTTKKLTGTTVTYHCPAAQVDKCTNNDAAKCPPECLDTDGKKKTDLDCLKVCLPWQHCFGNINAEGCIPNALACQPLLEISTGDQAKIDAAKAVCVAGQYNSDACLQACLPGLKCVLNTLMGLASTDASCPEWEEVCSPSVPVLEPCVACESGADADFPCLTACVPYIHCVGKGCVNTDAAPCDVLKSHPVDTEPRTLEKAQNACKSDPNGAGCIKECLPGIECVIGSFAGAVETADCAGWVATCKATFPKMTPTTVTTVTTAMTTSAVSHAMSSRVSISVFGFLFLVTLAIA